MTALRKSSHTLLLLALAMPAALAACSRTDAASEQATDPKLGGKVDGARAKQLVAEGAVLLDVRSPSEYAGGHAPGAVNIPVDELADRKAELPAGKPIVTYCSAGVRSARAAGMLRSDGRTVHDLGVLSAYPKD